MKKINWRDYIPEFETSWRLAYKDNGYAYFHDDSGNTLTVPVADVPAFHERMRKEREKNYSLVRIGLVVFIILLLVGLVLEMAM